LKLRFFKYHGTGNDFVLIDGFSQTIELAETQIAALCHRRFGVGADGVIVLQPHPDADFMMLYYNADGRPGSMCGNGGRCAVALAFHLGHIKEHTHFVAPDGMHQASIEANGHIRLEMRPTQAPVFLSSGHGVVNTGSPHYIAEVADVESLDMVAFGKSIRYSPDYADVGINVNAYTDHPEYLHVRTYERGVEDETYSCGTGVTAVALMSGRPSPVQIMTRGGTLTVEFNKLPGGRADHIYLTGPAELVFEGVVDLGTF
jgi:diaminopimelate epimerase